MEFLIRDRLGRLRFFGLEPGEAPRRVFRECLTRRSSSVVRCPVRGISPRWSDCGLVSAPGQCLREEDKHAVKRGAEDIWPDALGQAEWVIESLDRLFRNVIKIPPASFN